MAKNKNKVKENEVVEISKILEKFGKYQALQYFYCCLSALFATLITVNYVFVAGDINYRCLVPSCENDVPVFSPAWWPNDTLDRCYQPVLNESYQSSVCTNGSFTSHAERCSSWIYETNNTIVAEFDLACQPYKVSLVGMIHNMGMMIALPTSGWLSDTIGRKPTTVICAVGGVFGLLKLVASAYYPYIVIEFLEAAISGGVYMSTVVLMVEITGTKARIVPGVLLAYSVYVGELLYACIAMLLPNWKHLILVINFPNILFLSFIYIIKESPRWLIINGKLDEAKDTLLTIAKTNKINVRIENIGKATEETLKQEFNITNNAKDVTLMDIIKCVKLVKRIFVSFVAKFASNFVYYGLLVNSVNLPGNKNSNFLLAAVASFPGELIAMYLMNTIGRKKPLIYGFLTCGVFCFFCAIIPEANNWAKVTSFLISKMIVSACFTGIVTYTMELFPTSVRGSLCGFCTIASALGSTLAPLTPVLATIYAPLPFILFGFCAIISGLLITLTPETKGVPLIDTLAQINDSCKIKRENITGEDNPTFEDSI